MYFLLLPFHEVNTAIVLKYVMRGWKAVEESNPADGADASTRALLEFLKDVDGLKKEEDFHRVAGLVEKHKLLPEHLPTKSLKSKEVRLHCGLHATCIYCICSCDCEQLSPDY